MYVNEIYNFETLFCFDVQFVAENTTKKHW